MTPNALHSMNVWLVIIALVSLGELLLIASLGLLGYRLYRRAMSEIDRIEHHYVAPLSAKMTAVLNDAHDMARRVQRADDAVQNVVARIDETAGRVAATARRRAWPFVGVWRALRAGTATMFGRIQGDAYVPSTRGRP